jgi:WD40 repeat protein
MWDRETGKLLHSLRAQDQGSDLTGIAWNHAGAGQLMLASAAHDGTVRIWTAPWSGVEHMTKPRAPHATQAQDSADRNVSIRHHPVPVDLVHPEGSPAGPSFIIS